MLELKEMHYETETKGTMETFNAPKTDNMRYRIHVIHHRTNPKSASERIHFAVRLPSSQANMYIGWLLERILDPEIMKRKYFHLTSKVIVCSSFVCGVHNDAMEISIGSYYDPNPSPNASDKIIRSASIWNILEHKENQNARV